MMKIVLTPLLIITLCLGANAQQYVESKTGIPGNNANNAIGEKDAIWKNNQIAPSVQDNFPNAQNWWSIFQTQFADPAYDAQLAFGINKQDLWLRYNYDGNWQEWKKVLTEGTASGYTEVKFSIPSNDANNAKGEKSAIWRNDQMAPTVQNNFPNEQNWWSILQTQFGDRRYDAQLAFGLNRQDLWLRYNYDGNWQGWKKIVLANPNGNVGIGTGDPQGWKLAVNGQIRAKEIKVETGWSDFVFSDDYKLPSLEDVEKHIKNEGHLKDIPSAAEVEKNGIYLGEMDSKLLLKIEELTLYTIQQQKEIEMLKKENAELASMKAEFLKLQSKIEMLVSEE